MYDITDANSFKNLDVWINEIRTLKFKLNQ